MLTTAVRRAAVKPQDAEQVQQQGNRMFTP